MTFNFGAISSNRLDDPMNIILLTMLNRYMVENELEHVVIAREEFLAVQTRLGTRRHLRIDMTDPETMDVSFATQDEIDAEQASLPDVLAMLLGLEERLTPRDTLAERAWEAMQKATDTNGTADPNSPQRGADVAAEPFRDVAGDASRVLGDATKLS